VPLSAPLDARRGLLAGLIDHAPTFPPAELQLDEALADHEAALHSEPGWIVNRYVVRAAQLPDLPPDRPHRLSVVDGDELTYDPRIEAIEIPERTGAAPERSFDGGIDNAPESPAMWPERDPPLEVYFEHRLGPGFLHFVDRVATIATDPRARAAARAKIRCGPEAPSIAHLGDAIRACRDHGLAFKATAGLHHAVRTDEQHGFVNLLAAATFGDEDEALAETDPSAFSLDEEAFRWRDRAASPEEVATMRREVFVSFGSCSFTEPVDELRALGFV
jgi:hypothetical protein